jgi:hypothetical protein
MQSETLSLPQATYTQLLPKTSSLPHGQDMLYPGFGQKTIPDEDRAVYPC